MTFDIRPLRALVLAFLLVIGSFSTCVAAENVSLTIQKGDIRDVLAALSAISGQSIVTDDSVKGTISIDLENVPFTTALDLVTRSKGLAYKTVSNVIVVSSYENINKFFGNVGVYKLQYAKASEVLDTLKTIIKGDGLSADAVTNSIVFTGNGGEEAKLRDALTLLDVATKQVTLEAKIIAISVEDEKNLGVTWDWTVLPQSEDTGSSSSSKYGGIIDLSHGYTARFQATVNALITNGKAKILATPRIITIPGKAASIFIGDHIPVLTDKIENGTTTTTTSYVDAGIKLSYTPIVSDDGYITSVVHTEVSTPTLVSELKNYKITSRTADTNVRMRNGETLVIGGLINEEEQKSFKSIPFLSNIPLLGELFKSRSTTKSKTEVMMILTPYITNAGESPAIYNDKVKNASLTAVPGSQEEEEAKRIKREEQSISGEKVDASLSPVKKETMRQRFDARIAEQQTNENS
ncbi:MAG: type II and III secretion system protein [Acholeplasmataceae bacterium]|mgnify:CR=1 FL=1|jgi:Type II secretory pathway, component PulD|nr:type II and III secretion system protein [Acholeplasmataceae bacterium]